jgi:hypothetical protein
LWLLREVFGWKGVVFRADQRVRRVGRAQVVAVGRIDELQKDSGWEACEQVEMCGAEFRFSVVGEEAGD